MGAADYPLVTDETLPSLIEGEVASAIGHESGTLASERAKELEYYYGKPFGNEVDGESQVVSTDVADTVEGILPIILEIFTKSDDVVRFDPNGPEDEEEAKQRTEVANYVFYRQNNGFLTLYEWFKDALIQKNGVVKYWWDEKTTRAKESYQGLTEGEYKMLKEDDKAISIEELEVSHYDDPAAVQARAIMREQIARQVPPEAQPQAIALMEQQPIPQLYDCTLMITRDASKIRIMAIPPEEFGISAQHNCVSIQDTPFCYHRTRKSVSQLREMGVPEDMIQRIGATNEQDNSEESLARDRFLDDSWRSQNQSTVDRDVWVTECFYRVDYDNDGIAELRHIIMPGREIWVNEEAEHINFAALTPIIMPHRWIGRSVAELVMDIQFNKSVLKRQMYNNLYLTNNPQKAVLSSAGGIVQANLDDLLSSRPGGILREYIAGAIRNIETPFVAAASFPMIEYEDSVKETRTGVTRYNQGTDADTLNKTARGIQMIQAAGQQRTALIARIFAETGVKDLMRGITYMLSKYSDKPMTMKLRNKWVDIDPRAWKTQFNMTVNVGLGTGNRDVQLQHLMALHAQQIELMKTGRGYMVSDENVYNLYSKMSEAMGFKHPELFVTDPQKVPQQAKQRPPDPAMVKAQLDAQEGAAKLKQSAQKDQMDAQTELTVAQINSATQESIAKIKAATDLQIAQMQIQAQGQLAVFDKNNQITDQSGKVAQKEAQVNEAALKKGTELELREIKLAHEEQILALKKNIEALAENHRQELTKATVGRTEERETQVVKAMQTSMQQVAGELVKMSALLSESLKVQQQTVAAIQAPKETILGDVQMVDGKVVGATVKSRPVLQ